MINQNSHKLILKLIRDFLLVLFVALSFSMYSQQAKTYEEAVATADKHYKEKNYYNAKAYYQMALKYKSDDEYARSKLTDIVAQLKSQMAREDEYYDIVDLADVFYEEQAYDKALVQYGKALEIIPGDEYAREKVNEINRINSEEKDKMNAFILAMSEGNDLLADNKYDNAIKQFEIAQSLLPDRTAPLEKIELASRMKLENRDKLVIFNQEVEEAGRYLLIKNYVVALELYDKALALFPTNEDVLAKVDEIRPLAENQKKYNDQVELADELYISKDYMTAKSEYQKASQLWPENAYPQDMISRIDDQLADQMKNLDQNYRRSVKSADSLLDLKEYKLAKAEYNLALTLKPNEKHPKNKLKEIDAYFAERQKAFEADYSKMVAKADSLFDATQYIQAKDQYAFALTVKPDDEYPKQKLEEIDHQLNLLEAEKKLNTTYQELIDEADNLFSNGHYDLATKKYAEAQTVKSIEDYPQQRIAEIRQMLMDAEKQREIDENYGKLILVATRLFKEEKLDESKKAYQNALDLKPYETIPQQQVRKIDSIVNTRIRQAEIQKIFLVYMAKGDSLLNLNEFDPAITAYTEALNVKPTGVEADKRRLKARTMKSNYEKAIARQAAYDDAIRKGDRNFEDKSYELAKMDYEKAVKLKSSEGYPQQQINEINIILKRLEAEKEQRYQEAIVKADNFFEQQNYQEAVIQYKIANSIKPGESHPNQRIAQCNGFIAEQLRQAKARYDIAIADADKFYASKIYDKAIKAYQGAEKLKPDETYPREMITKITSYIEENAIVDVVNKLIAINSGVTEKFSFEPVKINVRKTNYVLVKARNLSGNDFKIIFTYGSSGSKNGGFVVQVPGSDEYNDYIIRVGNQYKWFSEDNDWISIYPEGGDIEIKMVRISTSN